ncbi:MAG: iron dependent repressor, metal binding and dimerization domain protein [Verrucomicrobiota bacterium]
MTKEKADIHRRVRKQHSSEIAQDYVEAIHELLKEGDAVKIQDLQEIFGVTHVTVIRTLQRLKEDGLVTATRSKQIQLTPEGKRIARKAAARHELLRQFFVALGVSEEQADADAEGAEHHLSEETLRAIRKFLSR